MSNNILLIDYETLGQSPDTVILSLGAIVFDMDDPPSYQEVLDQGFYETFSVDEQVKDGRVIDKSTVDWWGQQGKEAAHVLKPSDDDISYKEMIPRLKEYIGDVRGVKTFARSASFDFSITNDIVRRLGQQLPWQWWNERDTRTLIECYLELLEINKKNNFDVPDQGVEVVAHHALHDVAMDVVRISMLREAIYGEDDE